MEVDGRGTAVFSHAEFDSLLEGFARDGGVRYQAWSRDVAAIRQLDAYLTRIKRASPASAPNLFPTRGDRALYWICAHNAFVIRTILDHWPVEKVTDIRIGREPLRGWGYFRKPRFLAGGTKVSLAKITRSHLSRDAGKDARVTLLIHCGSRSCAPLRRDLARPASIEGLLASATAAFLNDPANLRVDHDARRLTVSAVLRRSRHMIRVDPRSGRGRGREALRRWLLTVAPPSLSPDLALARDYAIEFLPWDWTIRAS
jgi:hypothetical protein